MRSTMKRFSPSRLSTPVVALALVAALTIAIPSTASSEPSVAPAAAGGTALSPALGTTPGPKTFDLCASDGTIALADGSTVPVWGFVDISGGGTCGPGLVTSLPGPELRAVAGDSVTINLTNALATPTSILIPGHTGVTATGGSAGTFTSEAAASGGTVSYGFTAQEGSYLYESGTDADIQVAMGLYGALVVESTSAGTAYGYQHDTEEVLVLSEIDPVLNANPAGFDMLDYHPVYWLINGQSYSSTADPNAMSADEGERVLLRYLNAGYQNLSMSILGSHQRIIARNGYAAPSAIDVVAEIIPAGQTADMIVDTAGLGGTNLAIFNRNMNVTNNAAYPGGMLTFLSVAASGAPTVAITGPLDGDTVSGATVPITASASDDGTVTQVEFFVDGASIGVDTTSGDGWSTTWDSTTVSDGGAALTAEATDNDSNVRLSDPVSVTVDNVDDPPTAAIFAPTDASLVTGSVLVEAAAGDDRGLTQVEFFADAGSVGVDAVEADGWSTTWDSTTASDGSHSLTATATDTGAQSTTSVAVSVTVDNTAPFVSITSPADGDTVSGTVTVQASATDSTSGVAQVEFSVDGGSIGVDTDGSDGWSVEWDTTALNSGAYAVTATATDGVGMTATSTSVGVTVDNPVQTTLHVGDLDASVELENADLPNERWRATITVSVHDAVEVPLDGATVDLEFARINNNNGNTQTSTGSCTTGVGGQCSVTGPWNQSSNIEDIITVTVTGVTHASLTYEPADNHDPDPDPGPDVVDNSFSDGTTIEVEVHRP